jgi:hypothetical protein
MIGVFRVIVRYFREQFTICAIRETNICIARIGQESSTVHRLPSAVARRCGCTVGFSRTFLFWSHQMSLVSPQASVSKFTGFESVQRKALELLSHQVCNCAMLFHPCGLFMIDRETWRECLWETMIKRWVRFEYIWNGRHCFRNVQRMDQASTKREFYLTISICDDYVDCFNLSSAITRSREMSIVLWSHMFLYSIL